jgi:hypothetical protein
MRTAPLLGFLLTVAALSAADAPTEAKPTKQWPTGSYSRDGLGSRQGVWRIWDTEGWRKFWHERVRSEAPPAPDFAKGTVVVAAGGECPSGGHSVEVIRAVREDQDWFVEFIVRRPPPGAFVTMALTYPAAVAFFEGVELGQRPRWRDMTLREEKNR